jgi:hypothetical protein
MNDMWAPGITTSGASSVVYGGSPLDDNTDYWFGIRVNDGAEWSVWNETQFHMNSVEAQDLTIQNFAELTAGIMHITDHTPIFNWTFWDGEADFQTEYQVRVGSAPGLSNMWGPVSVPGAQTTETYAGSALLDGTDYWLGVRVHDGYEWSLWNETLFHMNSIEAQDPTVSGFSDPSPGIIHIIDHTPILGWTFFDNELDSQLQYEVRVGTVPGLSDMWNPGAQVSGVNSVVYGGSPLLDNTDYWYAIRVYDGFEWSQWTEVQFHLNTIAEAVDLTVDGFVDSSVGIMHINATNPDLGWTFFDLEIGDSQQQYEVRVGTSPGASDMWSLPAQIGPITSVTYAGLPLIDGTDYWFSVRVYDGFEWSGWNETQFHMNALPETYSVTVSGYLNSTTGIMHIVDHTPELGWIFQDPEVGDSQLQYEIWVGTAPGLSDMWDSGVKAGALTSEIYAGLALMDGTDYCFQIRVFDGFEWSNWNETIFHLNTPPPLPIFPISPVDDSNIPSSPAQTLSWTSGGPDSEGDTVQYYWYIDTIPIPAFPYLFNDTTTSTSSNPFPTNPATDYYWIVNVTDGWEWNTNVIWNFTTSAIVNNPPEAIDLLVHGFSEATAGIMHLTNHVPVFEWSFTDPDGGDVQQRYHVRVGTAAGLSDMWAPADQVGGASSETYAGSVLVDGVDYWFAVRVYDGNTWSAWNETQFHMNSVEARDLTVSGYLYNTAGILHIIDHTPDLAWMFWDAEVDTQQEYEIWVGTQSGFSDMWILSQGGPTTSEIYGGLTLNDGTDYYFQIRVNDSYEWSVWTEVMFHMNALPPAPTPPLSPPDDSNIPSSPAQTLSWTSGGADPEGDLITYWWYIDTDPIPAAPYVAEGNTIGTSSSSFATSPGTDYYWFVNATDSWEWNPSIIWNFTTSSVVNNPPEALDVMVSGFANGTIEIMHIIDHTPDFTWVFFDPDGGDSQQEYEIRVGTQSGFSDMWTYGPQPGAIFTETYSGLTLLDGTDYYLGIRTFDGSTWSVWNETLFHMNSLPPVPVPPLIPADDANIPVNPVQTVSWTPGGADPEGDTITYYWYVDTNNPPLFPFIANGTTTGTSSTSFGTVPGTEYFWIINVTDGWEWNTTIVWNFTTQGSVNIPPEVRDILVSGFSTGTSGILHITDHTPEFSWAFFDGDIGDFQIQFEIRVGTASGLSDIWNPGPKAGGNITEIYSGAPLVDGMDYWAGFLVYDGINWSVVNETMFHMNSLPDAVDLTVSGFSYGTTDIMHIIDHTPDLSWSFLDMELGDTQAEYEVRVGTASGLSDMWNPGVGVGAQTTETYSGSTLVDGTDYWFAIRVYDGYEWGVWNETQFHLNTPPPAPSTPISPQDDSNITENAAQTVSWTSGGADSEGDSVTYYWYVDTDILMTPPYLAYNMTTGLSSTPFIITTSSQYYWFVNITDGWEWSTSIIWNFSTMDPLNSVPNVQGLMVEGFSSGSQDILHLIEHTPELSWTFFDEDLGDSQVRYEIMVGTKSGSSDMWNPGPLDGTTATVTYAGSSLMDGENYYFNIKVFDGKNWSASYEIQFHMNIPPEVNELTVEGFTEGTLENMTISNSNPTFSGSYKDTDGLYDKQEYEIRIGSAQGFSDLWILGPEDGAFREVVYDGLSLSGGTSYWYGLRIFDGYEWSQWRETEFKMNAIPVLDWTDGSGFESDALDPETGNLTTTFVFKIKYTDSDGHAPDSAPKLHIMKWGLEITESPFAMIYESGSNETGAIYIYSIVLNEGTNYSYFITASDILGLEAQATSEKDGPDVIDDTPDLPPEPPTDVDITVPDDQGELRLSWKPSTGDIEGYYIYRSITPLSGSDYSNFQKIANVTTFTTSYTDKDLEDETTYYYLIKAFDSQGEESDYSQEVSGTTIAEPEEHVEEEDNFQFILLIIILIIIVVLILIIALKGKRRKEEEPIMSGEISSEIEEPSGAISKTESESSSVESPAPEDVEEPEIEKQEVEEPKKEETEVSEPKTEEPELEELLKEIELQKSDE